MFSASFLFASLIWSSIGVGFLVYGRRQKSLPASLGGIVMITASYFAPTALTMTLVCLIMAVIVCVLAKQGF